MSADEDAAFRISAHAAADPVLSSAIYRQALAEIAHIRAGADGWPTEPLKFRSIDFEGGKITIIFDRLTAAPPATGQGEYER